MKPHYYPETDSLYIELSAKPSSDTQETATGLLVDLDADGNVVGFDLDHASEKLDLATLEATALPVAATPHDPSAAIHSPWCPSGRTIHPLPTQQPSKRAG